MERNKEKLIQFSDWLLSKEFNICETTNGTTWTESLIGGKKFNSKEIVDMFLNENK